MLNFVIKYNKKITNSIYKEESYKYVIIINYKNYMINKLL